MRFNGVAFRRAVIACGFLFGAQPALATTYVFTGTITSFSDAGNRLGAASPVGSPFSGSVRFDQADIGNFVIGGPDRISEIDADSVSIGTPNDQAFVNRYGSDLFVGILAMNPVVFSTATATYACPGGGGVTLKTDSTMRLSFSCPGGLPGVTPIGIEGVGTYAAAGVPEPSMWTTMIAGFGLLGAAGRRRRRAAVSIG